MIKAEKKVWEKPEIKDLSVKKLTLHGDTPAHDESIGNTDLYFPGKRHSGS